MLAHDPTEAARRSLQQEVNADLSPREVLEHAHGQVWDTEQLREDFNVTGFMAPFVVVHRLGDGVKGTLMFQHSPRLYWGFQAD